MYAHSAPTSTNTRIHTQVAMHSMRVHWTIPDIRGSPISQYLVKVLPTQVVHKVSYNKIDYTVLDLEPGESYCFQVLACRTYRAPPVCAELTDGSLFDDLVP